MTKRWIMMTALMLAAWHVRAEVRVLRDIAYDAAQGAYGLGDLYLPGNRSAQTPVVLAIHGGGWSALDRYSWSGVATFFSRDLDCVVFNIAYRLAGAANRWPACGDDCLKAARWLFSADFRRHAGFSPRKIYICGGSAGGHLALWTLVNLPPEKVAGCVAISAIGNPVPDFKRHPSRYRPLFGEQVDAGDLAAMDPIPRIRPGMARVLSTHATADAVVPLASHGDFARAYRAAGNTCTFFEYPCSVRKGLTGHCIWIPGSDPHRLIPEIEAQIAAFMKGGGVAAADSRAP